MTNKVPIVACFGEILWDVFPDKQLLGGAPLNVAMRLRSLGADVYMISSVGADELGSSALDLISAHGLSTSLIPISNELRTGKVMVHLEHGGPSYKIEENVAWDHIPVSLKTEGAVRSADALIFGSLALRSTSNYEGLSSLLRICKYSVFDLNLRTPYYTATQIVALMQLAHFVKMNDEELEFVCASLSIEFDDMESQLTALSGITNTDTICVTLGSKGAILLHQGAFYRHNGFSVNVSDTVGAGDSFLAGLVYELLCDTHPLKALTRACALGALVASKAGANCEVTISEITQLIS